MMDEYRRFTDVSETDPQADPTSTAQSVRTDFTSLLDIFDRQLEQLTDAESRSHLLQARAAAARGLELSESLLDLMRASSGASGATANS
jgi:hypothetical protein